MTNILCAIEYTVLLTLSTIWIYKNEGKKLVYIIGNILTALLGFTISMYKGLTGVYIFLIPCILTIFVIISIQDIKTKYIPNILLLILNVFGLIASFFVPYGMFLSSLIASWIITGLCFLVGRRTKDGIGTGDLFCMSGLMMSMNFSGMMNFMFSSLALSLIYGIATLIFKKQSLKTEIAFAPFLLFGYLIMLLFI